MGLHLDYYRVLDINTPKALQTFLLTAHGNDVERRVKVAFPEFFTDDELDDVIHLSSLAKRAEALQPEGLDIESRLQETLSWFGLELLYFEGRTDGGDHRAFDNGIMVLGDFPLERDDQYNGLTDPTPWIAQLPDQNGIFQAVHVLDVAPVDEPGSFPHTKFFLLGVLAKNVTTSDLPYAEVDILY